MAATREHRPTPTHLIAVPNSPGYVPAVKVGYGDHGMTAHVITETLEDGEYVFSIMSRFYPYGGFTFVQEVTPVETITPNVV